MGASIMAQLANYNPAGFTLGNQNAAAEVAQRRAQTALTGATADQQQIENKILQTQIKDSDVLGKAFRDAQGDPQKTAMLAIQYGISPRGFMAYRDSHLKLLKSAADLTKEQKEIEAKRNEQIGGIYAGALQMTPEERAAAAPALAQQIQQIDPEHEVPDLTNDTAIKTGLARTSYYAKALEQQQKAGQIAQTEAQTVKTGQEIAATERTQAIQQLSGLVDPQTGAIDPQAYQQWRQAHPAMRAPALPSEAWIGQAITSAVPIASQPDYLLHRNLAKLKPEDFTAQVDALKLPPELASRTKTLVGQALAIGDRKAALAVIKDASDQVGKTETAVRTAEATKPIKIDIASALQGARAPQTSAEGLDLMAESALAGNFPSSRNPVLYAKVMDRAAQLAKERGLTAQEAVMARNSAQANKHAYDAVTKQYETLKPFAEMAEKNADLLEQKSREVSDLGAPLLNAPWRQLTSRFAGNTKVAAFQAALLPVQADFARILNSPTGGGVLSDHAREEMAVAISPNATVGQMKAAIDVFRQDARNRKEQYEAQLQDLKGRTVVTGAQPKAEGGGTAAPKATHRYNPATGKIEPI